VTASKSRWLRWLILMGSLIVLAGAGTTVFRGVGQWLVVEDPPDHADVIVVLSGHLPERAIEASRLYHAGYAARVWVSPPDSPVEELKKLNIPYVGEDFYNEKVLLAQNVQLDAITILENPIANTEEEVGQILADMRRDEFHTAMLVTSKVHTRRVRTIWHKLATPDSRLIVRFANDEAFDSAHWWRHTHEALDVLREVLGLLNAWAGFPLRPSQY
jgi:uncharacterized SAM-binding protein YcdF (DUF218 family)